MLWEWFKVSRERWGKLGKVYIFEEVLFKVRRFGGLGVFSLINSIG